jgi:Protein of unknown function (DUF1612)
MTGAPQIADLDWRALAQPLARAEDALARLDERLAKSPIRDGWIARTHFLDAAAALWLEGELVHLEDLVLHDAGMDVRTPTRALTRAHTVLRTRRRIAAAKPGWALSPARLDVLRGREGDAAPDGPDEVDDAERERGDDEEELGPPIADDAFTEVFASVDVAVAHADKTLADQRRARQGGERYPLIYDSDWDEEGRLTEWRAIVAETHDLPPTLAAAVSTRPGSPSSRCSARLGSSACSQPRCCATAARPAPISRASPRARKPCRASVGGHATWPRALSRSLTA